MLLRQKWKRVLSFCGKKSQMHGEFKIIGEVCWLNGVEFRVIDFEMTPKKTAFEFAESAKFRVFFSYVAISFFFSF